MTTIEIEVDTLSIILVVISQQCVNLNFDHLIKSFRKLALDRDYIKAMIMSTSKFQAAKTFF